MAGLYTELASCIVGGVEVRKLRSTKTGIVVCLAQVEGPLVNGYFCLATEAHDHDGLPHTLEHLIFLGSEDYPYKGVLDLLANRCLAQGTNAWTDVDHTCYTVMTAGSEGFLNLLPVYLDHILYPTLTDAGFLTEVHHVNGDGDDAGVVYCEMQARENTCEDRLHFQLVQHMYPGHCGYRSETGGRLENLRTSCSNEKVCSYHRTFYRPDNLCLIVTGQVDADQLFTAMATFEDKILSKGTLPALERPWQSPVPSLEGSISEEVPFPTDEEGEGMARLAWRGPQAQDRYNFTAMGVLLEYLTDTPVAPLQRELVEVDDPLCSDVSQEVMENAETCIGFSLTGVSTDKLGTVKDKVLSVLQGIANGTEALDSERMKTVIRRQMLNILNQVEASPHFFFAFSIIGDFLFGHTPQEFSAYLDQIPHYKQLLEQPPSFWVNMVRDYFIDRPHVVVLGSPSHELSEKMSAEEKERVRQQREGLGEGGRKQKASELEKAIEQNEIPPSDDVITTLSVPGTGSIRFHPLVAMGNHQPPSEIQGLPEYSQLPVHGVPFFFLAHHIHSAFVELTAILDTASLPQDLRPYLPLYLELLFESPILRNGELIPHEQVVKELSADTIATAASLGHRGRRFSCGQFSQAAFITIKVESGKYSRGVRWLQELLYGLQFTRERLAVVAQKMVSDVARMKRDGRHIARTVFRSINFTKESNHNLSNMVTQLKLLNSLLGQLKEPSSSAAGQILADMTRLRDALTSAKNLRVVMATDVNALPSPLDVWKEFLPTDESPPVPASLPKVIPAQGFLASEVQGKTLVAGVGGVESNFLIQSVPCVRSHDHPDLPAILVFVEYLCCLEGPLWKQVRGMGLSYHYSMGCKPEDGLLYFILLKSSQLTQAYEVARNIIDGFVTGKTPFERTQLESAISCVVYQVIEEEKTVADAAHRAMLRYLQQMPENHSKWLLDALSVVSLEDLRRVGRQYFSLLLNPSLTNTAVCCNPSKVAEVKAGLERIGHTVELVDDVDQLAVPVPLSTVH